MCVGTLSASIGKMPFASGAPLSPAIISRHMGNRRLHRACGRLRESEYLRDGFPAFGSLHATPNHIRFADRVWLARMEGRIPPGLDLEQILRAD
jgi:hypothetical protein